MLRTRRFLILACSQRKRQDPEPIPALERYDGPAFQLIRKYVRQRPNDQQSLDIYVLSARFGLISATETIPYYDQRMTAHRAAELRDHVLNRFSQQFQAGAYQQLLINVGRDYRHAVHGIEAIAPPDCSTIMLEGSQGRRLSQIRCWLYGDAPQQRSAHGPSASRVRLRGIELALSAVQVIDIARQALRLDIGDPSNFQSWYVDVDGEPVAPKWIVSQITGLSPHAFRTADALRVLTAFGIVVHHV